METAHKETREAWGRGQIMRRPGWLESCFTPHLASSHSHVCISDLSHPARCQQEPGLHPKSCLPGDHSLQSCSFTVFMSPFLHGKILNVIFPKARAFH